MGTISTGIGLISGINTADLIDQLIAIESRPKTLITNRNSVLTSQQTAFQEINAKLLVLKLSASSLITSKLFNATTAASSDESVLTATTGTSAAPGTFDFTVHRLVTAQQMISAGFIDHDTTAIAPAGATLTFESAAAKLESDTKLSTLNGGAGVPRGRIRVTDRSGASAIVDLSTALTLKDVLSAINQTSGINVTATAEGDRIKLVDHTGAAATNLAVTDVSQNGTAAALGLNLAAVGDTLTGSQINRVSASTLLATLNDGNGVRIASGLDDLQITRRDGTTFNVNLDGAATLGNVIDAINTASGGDVTAGINDAGTGLKLVDATIGGATSVAALNSSGAAADLGILGSDAGGTIVGTRVVAALNSKLLKNLNGGAGVSAGAPGSIRITNRAAVDTDVDLSSAASVHDVVGLINASGAGVTASLNASGNGIQLTDTTGATTSNLVVADLSGTAAADLNLDQSVAAATLDSGNLQLRYISESTQLRSLNGGRGVSSGKFLLTDSRGVSATVDLTQGNEKTIQDVINEINSRGLQLTARVNDNGDGIVIQDDGPGTVVISVAESGSTTARDLGLLGSAAAAGEDYNTSFQRTVTLEATDTLDDLLEKINDADLGVRASIINDGSGISPFRVSLVSKDAGRGGEFIFDDGGIGLGAATLVEAQDALVFYGSADPAKAIAITSITNTLTSVVPGATISLTGTSASPVRLSITRNESAVTDGVKKVVDDFNAVIESLNKFDKFDVETQQRGLLLGDPTVARVRSSLFRIVNGSASDVTGQFKNLSQIGITVGSGAKLTFNATKFAAALESDRSAVEQVLTLKETSTDSEGKITVTRAGFAQKFDSLLFSLTDGSTGALQTRVESIASQINLNKDRIENMDKLLAAKRGRLEAQFVAMESALAKMQAQSASLTSLANLAAQSSASA